MEINVEKLKNLANSMDNARILVIGDLALDEMVYGDTERISREAPVIILQHTYTRYILGGASNAAHNVATLNNGKISVIGVVGEDYHADDLRNAYILRTVGQVRCGLHPDIQFRAVGQLGR